MTAKDALMHGINEARKEVKSSNWLMRFLIWCWAEEPYVRVAKPIGV